MLTQGPALIIDPDGREMLGLMHLLGGTRPREALSPQAQREPDVFSSPVGGLAPEPQ